MTPKEREKELKRLESEIEKFKEYRVGKHFQEDGHRYPSHWVGSQTGETLGVNEMFFSLSDMMDFERYGYTTEQIENYYWYALDCRESDIYPINIKNYLKLKQSD